MLSLSVMRRVVALTNRSSGKRAFTPSITWNLNDDQLSYVEMAKAFSEKEFAPHAAQWDAERIFPKEVMQRAAAQGFGGIYCDPEQGGTGLTRLDASLIFEQLAAYDPSTTAFITIHNMCAWMVSSFGCEAIKSELAHKLCSMELFASYCLTEPSSGSDAAALATVAKDMGDHWEVTGSKAFISGGGATDVYVTMVRTGGAGAKGITCMVILKTDEGVSFGKNEHKHGWNSQPTRMVSFDKVKVPKTRIVGSEGEGFKIAMKGLDGGRVNIASCSLGAAQRSLDLAIQYAQDRKQFNTPLAGFQNTQFKLADMATAVHGSRLMVRQAAAAMDAKDPNATTYCAMAKMSATEQCYNVVDSSLQIHGGYGYLKDFPVERYLRDLRVHRILEGTNEVMRIIVSRTILSK